MKSVPIVLLPLFLNACSFLPDHTLDYRKASVLPRMQVPDDMTMDSSEDMFRVPEVDRRVAYREKDKFEAPTPPVAEVAVEPEPAADETVPDVRNTRIVLTRDGNDYPIIMIYTAFPWAWEYVGQSLADTDLRIEDRSRDAGIFFIRVPKQYGLNEKEAQIKLSHTVNGVQVAVLNSRGTALVDAGPGKAILQRLYDSL